MTRSTLLILIVLNCFAYSLAAAQTDETSSNSPAAETSKEKIGQTLPTAKTTGMPIYITPYYNVEGLQIDAGPYSDEMASATEDSIVELATKMKADWAVLSVEAMYVLSIRLYDLGHKDDSVYWFYSSQFRARLLRSALKEDSIGSMGSEGFERIQAHGSFQQLAGQYINGYGFGELDKLQKTIREVISESATIPQFRTIYPKLEFCDSELWPDKSKEIGTGLKKLLDHIESNAEEIKAARKKNGIEGKY